MLDNLLVSVIVPVYNVEKYLNRCIESVIQQSYSNLEIILVDDGSTDNSSKICRDFEKKDGRIVLISQANKGLSAARNTGIRYHHGKFIVFIDSDDYIHRSMIETMLVSLVKNDADIVECGIRLVSERNAENDFFQFQEKSINLKRKLRILTHDEALENCLDYRIKIMAWNKMYRTELFKRISFPEGKLHEDEYTTPYLVDGCSRYVITPQPFYTYVQRENSIMSSGFNMRRLDILGAHQQRLEYFSKRYSGKYNGMIKYHFLIACMLLKSGMKELYSQSDVEKEYDKLFPELLFSHEVSIEKKMKIIYYELKMHMFY